MNVCRNPSLALAVVLMISGAACGDDDGAAPDAGNANTPPPDAAAADAASPDGAVPDAGSPDTGVSDSGTSDGSTPDGSTATTFELLCDDGLDNDGDSAMDCADPDCANDGACTGTSCLEVLSCSQTCGIDMNCINACSAAACPSAQAAWGDMSSTGVSGCMVSNCLWSGCATDPTGTQCMTCLTTSCSAEIAACGQNTCASYGETDCTDGVDNGGSPAVDCNDIDCVAEPTCGGSGLTCDQAYACSQACSADLGCIVGCRNSGCQSAEAAFSDLTGCMMGSCMMECSANPGDPTCTSCFSANCATETAACTANTCQ